MLRKTGLEVDSGKALGGTLGLHRWTLRYKVEGMKAIARVGAILSFSCFLVAGVVTLGIASRAGPDVQMISVLGLCLLGVGFFLGSFLWLAAERYCGKAGGR